MDTEPIAVALKFGFLAVLYLFLFWVSRSALRELRRTSAPAPEATGFHAVGPGGRAAATDAWLVAVQGGGLPPGERFDLFGGLSIGRSIDADVRIEDRFASSIHARVYSRGATYYVEDMNSTNGTFLNGGRSRGRRSSRTSTRSGSATPSCGSSLRCPRSPDAARLRAGIPLRHGPAAERERGLLLRQGAGVRGRRRDGRSPGRRGGFEDRGRVVRVGRARRGGSGGLPARTRRGRERAHPRLGQGRLVPLRDGDDADRRARRGRRGRDRPRRRQPRLRLSRGGAEAADLRPLAGRGASPPGPADRRAGRGSSAALDHHPGARPGGRGRGGHDDLQRPPGRRLPAVLGRADDDAQGGADRGDARLGAQPRRGRLAARPRGQRRRWPRQHHGGRLSPRGGRRSGRRRRSHPDRTQRRGSGADGRAGPRRRRAPRARRSARRRAAGRCGRRRSCSRSRWSSPGSASRPSTESARSTSSASTRAAGSPSTVAFRTTSRSTSASTRRSTRSRFRPRRCPRTAKRASPTTRCARTTTPSPCSTTSRPPPSPRSPHRRTTRTGRRGQAGEGLNRNRQGGSQQGSTGGRQSGQGQSSQ